MILFRFNASVDCSTRLIIVAELKPFTQGDNPLKLLGGDDDEGEWVVITQLRFKLETCAATREPARQVNTKIRTQDGISNFFSAFFPNLPFSRPFSICQPICKVLEKPNVDHRAIFDQQEYTSSSGACRRDDIFPAPVIWVFVVLGSSGCSGAISRCFSLNSGSAHNTIRAGPPQLRPAPHQPL